jgi:hypothetical protein
MAKVEILVGWNWGVQEQKVEDVETGEVKVTGRMLFFVDPSTQTQIQVPLDLPVAEDMGGQLQGHPPRKHVEVAQPQTIQQIIQGMRPNGPAG